MLLLGYDIIILGDLNCNILDDTADSRILKFQSDTTSEGTD